MLKGIALCGPSGSGKSTLSKHLIKNIAGLEFSVSACSREPRLGEKNGLDYFFLSLEIFHQKIREDAFLEYEEVYPGSMYGTLTAHLEGIWEKNHTALFDVDVKGCLNLKDKLKDNLYTVFIAPPSISELENRLRLRKTEGQNDLKKRLEKARFELSYKDRFDRVFINDTPIGQSCQRIESYVRHILR